MGRSCGYETVIEEYWASRLGESGIYLSLCRPSGELCCDWMSLTKGEGLSFPQVGEEGGQTHLHPVDEVYPSFYLAGDGK